MPFEFSAYGNAGSYGESAKGWKFLVSKAHS